MPASPKPVRSATEEHRRAQRIFARLMAGESIRAIAAAESLSLRRVQQIVRERLDWQDFNPADDYALLQIARLERALDLVGAQIDAGKPSAAHAFVRILDHLDRLAPRRLRMDVPFQGIGDEVEINDRPARPPRRGARGPRAETSRKAYESAGRQNSETKSASSR